MFSQLLKLIWNRKYSNLLIFIEICIVSVVLISIFSILISLYQRYHTPLGFNSHDGWSINISLPGQWRGEQDREVLRQLVKRLEQEQEITTVNPISHSVFTTSNWTTQKHINEKKVVFRANSIIPEGPANLGVELVKGRWFGLQDQGQHYIALTVNQHFVDKFLQGIDPIDFEFPSVGEPNSTIFRIVGVYREFRQHGEFQKIGPHAFFPYFWHGRNYSGSIKRIELTFDRPMSISYQEELLRVLHGVSPSWHYRLQTWENKRKSLIARRIKPLIVQGIVVVFSLVMVALGLYGVLTQNIKRRRNEIGLMRALGASKKAIQWQLFSEISLVGSIGVICGTLFVFQLYWLRLVPMVDGPIFFKSFLISYTLIFILISLCSWVPIRRATVISPSAALHYE